MTILVVQVMSSSMLIAIGVVMYCARRLCRRRPIQFVQMPNFGLAVPHVADAILAPKVGSLEAPCGSEASRSRLRTAAGNASDFRESAAAATSDLW
jgi:hypothetical protein